MEGDNQKPMIPPRLEGETKADYHQRLFNAGINVPDVYDDSSDDDVPGGPAQPMPKKEDNQDDQLRDTAKDRLVDEGKRRVGTVAKQAGKAAADAAKAAAKKAAQAIAKWAAQAGAKLAAMTAEYWVPILFIIIALILIGFAIFMFIRAYQTPNAYGSSPTVPTDITADRPWISKVLLLTGSKNISQQLTDEVLNGLENDLSALESEMRTPPFSEYPQDKKTKISQTINEVRGLISKFKSAPEDGDQKKKIAENIVTKLGELIDLFPTTVAVYGGQTQYPIEPSAVTGFTNTLHCGTASNSQKCRRTENGKSIVQHHGTFIQYDKLTSDAVDIYANSGTTVRAAFGGKVVKKTPNRVVVSDGDYEAVYAHITDVKVGNQQQIASGEELGKLAKLERVGSHLHFELYYKGQAVVTTKSDLINHQSGDRKYEQIGEYLYERICIALKLAKKP